MACCNHCHLRIIQLNVMLIVLLIKYLKRRKVEKLRNYIFNFIQFQNKNSSTKEKCLRIKISLRELFI